MTQSVLVKEPLKREQRKFVVPDPDEMYTQSLILEQRQQLEQQFA